MSPSYSRCPRKRNRSSDNAAIVPRIVEKNVEIAATISEFFRALITDSLANTSRYQRSDGSVQIPTLLLALNEKTTSTTVIIPTDRAEPNGWLRAARNWLTM